MQTSLELKEVDKLNKHPKFDPKNLTNQVSHLFHDSGRLVVGMHPKWTSIRGEGKVAEW